MLRAFALALASIIIVMAILSGGCTENRPEAAEDLNNTTTATGYVYLDGKAVAGARVEAVSVDGTRHAYNTTNETGTYVLNLAPQVWYRVTATSRGLKHTVWPVFVSEDSYAKNGFDINLTSKPSSIIAGAPNRDSKWKGDNTYITVAPADGSAPVTVITGDDGSYSIVVKPDMYYTVSGICYDYRGASINIPISYRNTIGCGKVKPGPGETVLLDYYNPLETAPVLIVNGTVGLTKQNATLPAPQPSGPVPAYGHVYLDGSPVKGARVEAASIDGADHIANVTDGSGAYVLNVEPGVQYKVTATYKGFRHTLWPLRIAQDGSGNDIYLTAESKSLIKISYSQNNWYNESQALIEAVPADGGTPVFAMTDGSGVISLEVKPDVQYSLAVRCYDSFGQASYPNVNYPYDNPGKIIRLNPDETLLVDMGITFVHPPLSISMWRDPVMGQYDPFKPPVQVNISGYVSFNDKPVSGAHVDAFRPQATRDSYISAVTNESGGYTMTVSSRTQYTLLATYNGLSHGIWPVIVQDNTTGVYNINIPWAITSTVAAIPTEKQDWLACPGNVIMAVPVDGGKPVTAITADNGSYSLDVEPFTYYDISGKCQAPDGQYYNLSFVYANGVSCKGFMLRENETAFINYYTMEYPARMS
jgi:hypothetical protein